ncbi:HNH endonuclease signature motif containing protein [Brachybacterium sp. UNK5269]|uniref:HNH endonuclease signature motif containing protein n=1 Tax=Brachybacterium sp. UNK5269 TaxID=3408576 RepID=UPI003BAED8F9
MGELEPDGDGVPCWSVRARHGLTEDRIVHDAEAEPGSAQAQTVLALHHTLRGRARLYARHLELLTTFFVQDAENEGLLEDADVSALKIATGLRVSTVQATGMLRDAHRAVHCMPQTFAYLQRGDLPEHFHHYLLRRVRGLTEEQARQVDAHLARVELPSVPRESFEAQVRLAVRLATAGTIPAPASSLRSVEISNVDDEAGTASVTITGPIPEIKALVHRLEVTSRAVQKAQRAALEDGQEGPLPFDIDENLRERGKALSLRTLRYAILVHSILDIDPVQETCRPYKILVTIPVTTLLGMDEAPGMLDGLTPIPAEQARQLAAGEATWQRILTEPLTGAYLPVAATTYQPSAQMRLQLRLRHPVCAAPGCTRPTVLAAEDDHIIEYDHEHPAAGGQTSLWNLHRLCWVHHQAKTAGDIDPERDPGDDPTRNRDGSIPAGPVETTWTLGGDLRTRTREHTDLLSPRTAAFLDSAWRIHQRKREDALRLQAEEKARPREERVAEQRYEAICKVYPKRRLIPPGHHTPPPDSDDPPPF